MTSTIAPTTPPPNTPAVPPPGSPGPPLGTAGSWSRDLALVGGASSLLAAGGAVMLNVPIVTWGYAISATLAGALTGAILGPLNRRLFLSKLGKVKVYKLLVAGILTGAIWGGGTGALAGLYYYWFGKAAISTDARFASVIAAATAGALQYGWFWLPYTVKRAKAKRTWPLLLGTALTAPLLGCLGIASFFWLILG